MRLLQSPEYPNEVDHYRGLNILMRLLQRPEYPNEVDHYRGLNIPMS